MTRERVTVTAGRRVGGPPVGFTQAARSAV